VFDWDLAKAAAAAVEASSLIPKQRKALRSNNRVPDALGGPSPTASGSTQVPIMTIITEAPPSSEPLVKLILFQGLYKVQFVRGVGRRLLESMVDFATLVTATQVMGNG
jgi:hypothetical protein